MVYVRIYVRLPKPEPLFDNKQDIAIDYRFSYHGPPITKEWIIENFGVWIRNEPAKVTKILFDDGTGLQEVQIDGND